MKDILFEKFIIVHNNDEKNLLLEYAKSLGYQIKDTYFNPHMYDTDYVYRFTSHFNVGRASVVGWYPRNREYNCKEETDISMIMNHLIAFKIKQEGNIHEGI